MDYQEFPGEVISEQDKAFAQEFANFVNGRMCSADKTGKELTRAHRYLQQQMFRVFIGFMRRGYRRGTIVAKTARGFVVQFSSGAEIEVYEDEIEFD